MPWTEAQIAMLAEMGLPVWQPAPAAPTAPAPAPLSPAATTAPATALATAATPPPPPSAPVVKRPAPPPAAPAPAPAPAPTPAPHPRSDTAAIAQLGWPALRQAVADCRACKLCESRKQTVFGVGHEQAHWMIVGEAPGEQEDAQGEPFVGTSGQLLDRMLAALKLSRSAGPAQQQVYIANTLKCRPPHNRNPEPAELAQCEPFLARQVALVQPKIIVAMGRFAVQSLLRTGEPIGKLRGRVHRYQGVPLVVTYHPAYLLRSPTEKARSWEDLCLAAQTYEDSL